jgi:molecular chaperone GrpE
MKKGKTKKPEKGPDSEGVEVTAAETRADGERVEEGEVREHAEPSDPIAELRAEVDSLKDSLLRAKADFQNLQRRSGIERAEAVRYANVELMRSLLGVLDDFERSLAAAGSSDEAKPVVDGVRLVYENLLKALRQHGLEPIEALHRPFDPHFHEAIMQQPSSEHPEGTVLEEAARGYKLRDRVIRPTKVIVSKSPAVESAGASEDIGKKAAQDESARKEGEPA